VSEERIAAIGRGVTGVDRSAPADRMEARDDRVARQRWSSRGLRRFVLLAATDLVVLTAAAILAYLLWALPIHSQSPRTYIELYPLLGLFVLAYARNGLYPGFGLGGIQILRRYSFGTSQVFVLLAALDFVFKLPPVYSRMTFALAWLLALALVPLGRLLVSLAVRRWTWWGEPCLVLGTGEVARQTVASLQSALTLGYRPVAVLSRPGDPPQESVHGVPVLGTVEQAESLARQGVGIAILVDGRETRWTPHDLAHLQTLFRHVLWVHQPGEAPVEGLQIRNLGAVFGVEYVNQLLVHRNQVVKRIVDLVVGTLLAVVTLPLLLLCMLAVKLSSRGPVFYSHVREGLGGRLIRVWKLRTMYPDAEQRLEQTIADDPDLRQEWERRFKLASDPRIVPGVGRFLRRFSLDELPQLWQVVVGTMSLVGPRPFPRYHLSRFDPAILELRRRVRPGVTGLWQVKVRSTADLDLQQSHDAYYIRNWSLWMDAYVLGRTLGAVLSSRGAS
jgi:Undecaprenyl-phosphate galactose phosphotransferase WbaP